MSLRYETPGQYIAAFDRGTDILDQLIVSQEKLTPLSDLTLTFTARGLHLDVPVDVRFWRLRPAL